MRKAGTNDEKHQRAEYAYGDRRARGLRRAALSSTQRETARCLHCLLTHGRLRDAGDVVRAIDYDPALAVALPAKTFYTFLSCMHARIFWRTRWAGSSQACTDRSMVEPRKKSVIEKWQSWGAVPASRRVSGQSRVKMHN
eukprot:5561174-Pleurochrysis_carterae.AAC.1